MSGQPLIATTRNPSKAQRADRKWKDYAMTGTTYKHCACPATSECIKSSDRTAERHTNSESKTASSSG